MSTPNPTTTPWVPVWNLNGAIDLRYNGAHVAGATYADGDIVVKDGIAYLCVRPTVNPPAIWPMAPGTSAYGTSLPTSPYNGQQAVLVDSLTNPTYQWAFRYNANSTSPNRWEYVGGASANIQDDTVVSTASGSAVTLGSLGPFTIPRAGDYSFVWVAQFSNVTVNTRNYASLHLTGSGPLADALALSTVSSNNADNGSIAGQWMQGGFTVGQTITMSHRVNGGTATYFGRRVAITPRRVA